MRRYDDPVEVRQGEEGPSQFLWRGRLWQVREVLAQWVETGAWWESAEARATVGTDEGDTLVVAPRSDLMAERHFWRVQAGRGVGRGPDWSGVFDLAFSWTDGSWRLVGCLD